MSDINQLAVTGRVGADVELRYTPGGTAVLNIRFAVGGRKKVGDSWTDTVTWLQTTAFGKRAEALANILHKGSRIGVQGRLEVREYEDKNGTRQRSVEVFADDIVLLDGKRDGGQQRQDHAPAGEPAGGWGGDDVPFAAVDGRLL